MIGTHERAGADVGERMLEQEEGLIASEARVPAEKAVTASGDEFTQVVLAEIHIVMGCDQRCLRRCTRVRIVKHLTRIEARAVAEVIETN